MLMGAKMIPWLLGTAMYVTTVVAALKCMRDGWTAGDPDPQRRPKAYMECNAKDKRCMYVEWSINGLTEYGCDYTDEVHENGCITITLPAIHDGAPGAVCFCNNFDCCNPRDPSDTKGCKGLTPGGEGGKGAAGTMSGWPGCFWFLWALMVVAACGKVVNCLYL